MVSWQTKLAQIIVSERAAEEEDGVRKYFLKHVTLMFQSLVVVVVAPIWKLALWHEGEASTITEIKIKSE